MYEVMGSPCETNENDAANRDVRCDALDCGVNSHLNESRNRHMTKCWSPSVPRRINNAKCYGCGATSSSDRLQADKKSLYRAYSSYGFSQSRWSLVEGASKDWPDDRSEKKTACCARRYELADFHRCFKLLGVNFNQAEVQPQRPKIPDTSKVKPKITTRLTQSTVSLEDVQDAVLNDFERSHIFDHNNRSFLAQAVYERWYFNKMQQRKKQQKETQLKNELMRMEFERMRCEQKLKAEKSYREWMEKKKKSADSAPKSESAEKSKRSSERKFLPKNIEKEYAKWKTTKNEELAKKRQQWKEQKQRENEEKQRKKLEAEKAYQAWKNKINEDTKKKIEQQKKQKEEKKEEENRNKLEKEKEAMTSFNAWKQNKSQQLKSTRDKQKQDSKLKIEARTRRIAERLYEAEQAFYEWLDSVDKRINSAK